MSNTFLIRGLEEILSGLNQASEKISTFIESSSITQAEKRRLERLEVNIQSERVALERVLPTLKKDSKEYISPKFIAYINDAQTSLFVINESRTTHLDRTKRENKIPIDDQSDLNPLLKWAEDVQLKGQAYKHKMLQETSSAD